MPKMVRLYDGDNPTGYAIPESKLATWTDPATGKTVDQLRWKAKYLDEGGAYEMPERVEERIAEAKEERAQDREAAKAGKDKG